MPRSSHSQLRIRITSGNPDVPALHVRGALYGSGSAAIDIIDGVTPLERTVDGPVLSGMVQAVEARHRVHVDVVRRQDDHPVMGACARTVLFGAHLRAGHLIRGAA
jgi:hypothetical protein